MKILMILALVYSISAFAQIEIKPLNAQQNVFPGDVVEVSVSVTDPELVNIVSPSEVREAGSKNTLLFMGVNPWEKNQEGWRFVGKVVLGPEFSPDKPVVLTIKNQSLEIKFKGWMWNPQPGQTPPEYIYENVPLFSISWFKKNLKKSLLALLVIGVVGFYFGRRLYLNRKSKIAIQKKKEDWYLRIENSRDIVAMSLLWRDRDEMKEVFPNSEKEQRAFFDLLNKSQFKPKITSDEMKALVDGQAKMLNQIKEQERGV